MIEHLYIHIPFCHRVCPYCGFHKHTPGATDIAAFVRAVLGELAIHRRGLDLRPRTIYLGGGTPTMLSEAHLDSLLGGLRAALDLSGLEEFGLEANPRTIGPSKARLLVAHGVSRVSLGVQSWDESVLRTLGRDHAPAEAEETYRELRDAGVPAVNVDLMFSIPGQTVESWRATLGRTLALAPDHVSAYNLTYEEDTDFLRQLQGGRLDRDPDRDADQFMLAADLLVTAGFEHYEISNYARPGHRSIHNEAYWRGADYLGLGPSAWSTVRRHRWRNLADTAGYLRAVAEGRVPVTESEELDDRAWLMERLALELRMAEGAPEERVVPRLRGALEDLVREGLVERSGGRVVLTRSGRPLADRIAEMLLPDD